jgi:GTPase SAR1 family protein
MTYPKGHEKEGQPLDKICIIGQSGTGKTNLLNIIKKSVIDFSQEPTNSYLPFSSFSDDNSYISSKLLSKDNLLCEKLFPKSSSTLTSTQDIKLNENEKKYFIVYF